MVGTSSVLIREVPFIEGVLIQILCIYIHWLCNIIVVKCDNTVQWSTEGAEISVAHLFLSFDIKLLQVSLFHSYYLHYPASLGGSTLSTLSKMQN